VTAKQGMERKLGRKSEDAAYGKLTDRIESVVKTEMERRRL
jgi:hypothetical protein